MCMVVVASDEVFLQIVDLLHFFEEFLLAVVLALEPFLAEDLAAGDGFAEGD